MKNTIKMIALLLITGSFLLTACQPSASKAEGQSWQLLEISGAAVLPDSDINLQLNDGTITGKDGCNLMSGTYTLTGDSIEIGEDLVSTLMACEEEIMNQANAYVKALLAAETFKVENDRLEFFAADGASLLVFEKLK